MVGVVSHPVRNTSNSISKKRTPIFITEVSLQKVNNNVDFIDVYSQLIEDVSEQDVWVLIVSFKNKFRWEDEKGDAVYRFKLQSDLTDKEKKMIENSDSHDFIISRDSTGIFRALCYKRPDFVEASNKTMTYIGLKPNLEKLMSQYGDVYRDRFKPAINMKPGTERHFGDIFSESSDILPLIIDVLDIEDTTYEERGRVIDEITYKVKLTNPYSKGNEYVVLEICESSTYSTKDGFSFSDIIDENYMGTYSQAYQTALRWWEMERKHIVEKIKKAKIRMFMGRKAKESFKGIIDESNNIRGYKDKIDKDDKVLIINLKNFKEYKTGNTYRIKDYKDLTDEEKAEIKDMERITDSFPFVIYKRRLYPKSSSTGLHKKIVIIGDPLRVQEMLTRHKTNLGGNLREEIPMKSKTKEHFGDIIEKIIKENTEEDYVLALNFEDSLSSGGRFSSGYSGRVKFVLKPKNELPSKYQEMFADIRKKSDYIDHKRLKIRNYLSLYWGDGFKVEFYEGDRRGLEIELNNTKDRWGEKNVQPDILSKKETEKHFRDIV